jgi:hypothetical protein
MLGTILTSLHFIFMLQGGQDVMIAHWSPAAGKKGGPLSVTVMTAQRVRVRVIVTVCVWIQMHKRGEMAG